MLQKLESVPKNEDEYVNSTLKDKIFYKVNLIYKNKKFMVIGGAGVFLLAVMLFAVSLLKINNPSAEQNSLQEKHNKFMERRLNEISANVQDLSHNPNNSTQQKLALANIEKQVQDTRQAITNVAKISDIDKIASQVTAVKENVDLQMADIKKAVSEGMGSKHYLDASALPFKVISVDIVGSQPYATVNFENHVSPLGVSDLLAGWRLVLADYDMGIAEFVNDKNQYVKVSLQG